MAATGNRDATRPALHPATWHAVLVVGMPVAQCRRTHGSGSEIARRWRWAGGDTRSWARSVSAWMGGGLLSTLRVVPVEQLRADRGAARPRGRQSVQISSRKTGETLSQREENTRRDMSGACGRAREALAGYARCFVGRDSARSRLLCLTGKSGGSTGAERHDDARWHRHTAKKRRKSASIGAVNLDFSTSSSPSK